MNRLSLSLLFLLFSAFAFSSHSNAQGCSRIFRPTVSPKSFNFGTVPFGQTPSFVLKISVPFDPLGGALIIDVKSHDPAFVITKPIKNVCLLLGKSVSTTIEFHPKTPDLVISTIEIIHSGS